DLLGADAEVAEMRARALRAKIGRGQREVAVVAAHAAQAQVERERDATVRATHHVAAERALQVVRVAAAAREEQRLAAGGEVGDNRLLQSRSEDRGIALGPL